MASNSKICVDYTQEFFSRILQSIVRGVSYTQIIRVMFVISHDIPNNTSYTGEDRLGSSALVRQLV